MSRGTDAPVDLYVAAYADEDAARGDWDAIKQLAKDDSIKVDGLILVSRGGDGKIHVDDDFHETRKGAEWGAGTGALLSHADKSAIKLQVDDTLLLQSSGIVAMFEEQWQADIDKVLSNASKVTKKTVDGKSAKQVKDAATAKEPVATA